MTTERTELFKRLNLNEDLWHVANQYITLQNKQEKQQPLVEQAIRILSELELKGLKPVFDPDVEVAEMKVSIGARERAEILEHTGADAVKLLEQALINHIIMTTQIAINDLVDKGATELRVAFPIKSIYILAMAGESTRIVASYAMKVK